MLRWTIRVSVLALGCTTVSRPRDFPAAGQPAQHVYVVGHGWHTGLAVQRAAVADAVWARDFPQADILELGWGDAGYYPTPRPTMWQASRAVFWPTPSVVQVVGLAGTVTNFFWGHPVVRLPVSAQGFERLRQHFDRTFLLDAAGQPQPVAPALYGEGRFYQARGKFYFPKMCNHWVAAGLQAAGYPFSPWRMIISDQVMAHASRFGEPLTPSARRLARGDHDGRPPGPSARRRGNPRWPLPARRAAHGNPPEATDTLTTGSSAP